MTRLGQARVSTADQNTELQIQELEAAGCERIDRDPRISGTKTSRSELDKMLERLSLGEAPGHRLETGSARAQHARSARTPR